jgi:chemotaxis family two-component system response regulator Rcp1
MITRILLIEDNRAHAILVKEIFKLEDGRIDLHHLTTGEQALLWLPLHRPDVILLDLNLPGMYGLEVLHRLKADEKLKSIPVIILTTSQQETDIVESYNAQAACYIIKPVNYDKWTTAIGHIAGLYGMAAKIRK